MDGQPDNSPLGCQLPSAFLLHLSHESFSAKDCNFHQARSQDTTECIFISFADGLDELMNDAKVCFAIPFCSFTHYLVLRRLFSIINHYQASIHFDVTPVQIQIIPDFHLSSDAFSSYSDVQTSGGIKYGSQPSMPLTNHD